MRNVALAALAVGSLTVGSLGAASVFAADAKLLGKDAPALEVKEFLQCDGRTQVADFKGEVLFIECFATW